MHSAHTPMKLRHFTRENLCRIMLARRNPSGNRQKQSRHNYGRLVGNRRSHGKTACKKRRKSRARRKTRGPSSRAFGVARRCRCMGTGGCRLCGRILRQRRPERRFRRRSSAVRRFPTLKRSPFRPCNPSVARKLTGAARRFCSLGAAIASIAPRTLLHVVLPPTETVLIKT